MVSNAFSKSTKRKIPGSFFTSVYPIMSPKRAIDITNELNSKKYSSNVSVYYRVT